MVKSNKLDVIDYLEKTTKFLYADLDIYQNIINKKENTLVDILFKKNITETNSYRATLPFSMALINHVIIVGFLIGRRKKFYPRSIRQLVDFLYMAALKYEDIILLENFFRKGVFNSYLPTDGMCIAAHSKYPLDKLFIYENGLIILNLNAFIVIIKTTMDVILSKEYIQSRSRFMEKQYHKMIPEIELYNDEDFNHE